jgi:hypothetical protein
MVNAGSVTDEQFQVVTDSQFMAWITNDEDLASTKDDIIYRSF